MALWGSNPSLSRLVLDAVPPVALAWSRWFVVLVAVLPLVWPERQVILEAVRTRWRTLLALAIKARGLARPKAAARVADELERLVAA